MTDRVVLPDCCEDWILEYGRFYHPGDRFACPECRTPWEKTGRTEFRRDSDRRTFAEQARLGDEVSFRYLAATAGPGPIVERCCAKIILGKGPAMAEGRFSCPICRAEWRRGTHRAGGLRIASFTRADLDEPFVIQTGQTRSFLVPLSSWVPARD